MIPIKTNCKKCNCEIYAKYDPITSLNDKNPDKSIFQFLKKNKIKNTKYFSQLKHKPTKTCNTSIYLTCENGHMLKYYCEILESEKNETTII